MPGTTTVNAIPYPVVADNNATATNIQTLADYIDSRVYSAGDIKTSIRVTAETGWAAMNGQVLTNAIVANPRLWAVAPAIWKGAADITLPNWNDGYVMRGSAETGGSAIGASTGANTKTLTIAELASHTHPIAHTHTLTGNTDGAGAHGHAISHDHAAFTSGFAGGHNHNIGAGNQIYYVAPVGQFEGFVANGSAGRSGAWSDHAGHDHSIDVPAFAGSTSGDPANHTHGVTAMGTSQPSNASSTGAGSDTAFSIRSKSAGVNFFIKLG